MLDIGLRNMANTSAKPRTVYRFVLRGNHGDQYIMYRRSDQSILAQRRWGAKMYGLGLIDVAASETHLLYNYLRENDTVAYKRIRDKAKWEHMTPFAILEQWGDPRKWN